MKKLDFYTYPGYPWGYPGTLGTTLGPLGLPRDPWDYPGTLGATLGPLGAEQIEVQGIKQ